MKQTAVEWFTQELDKRYCVILNYPEYQKLIKQAKEMEKQEIIEAFVDGADKGEMFNNENRAFTTDAEQYYNETFNKQ